MKEKTKRLLSLLLTVVMLVTAQGFATLADTVSENEVQNISVEEAGENSAQGVEDDDEAGGNIEIGEEDAALEAQTQAAAPANPVHHCVKESTDWFYIYFGSYPQSEVTDSDIIAAIDSAIEARDAVAGADLAVAGDTEMVSIDTTAAGDAETAGIEVDMVEAVGTDVELGDGTKYRRISKDDCNNTKFFDDVENNGYRYFQWERIRWRVLDNNDDGTLFIMADIALDCKCYNDEDMDITWENSTIRNWLNGNFYRSAFSSAEQSTIESWHVVDKNHLYAGTEDGNDTTDHIYLLSIGEVTNEKYGFCSDYSIYSASRCLQTSDYAHARGAWRDTISEYEGNCWWWLRSPGSYGSNAALVYYSGCVVNYGSSVDDNFCSVAPALHINLSSDLWAVADNGSSGEGGSIPRNPVHHCEVKEDVTDWSYVYFGSYPQSEVTDSETIAAIDSVVASGNATEAADGVGVDVWVNGTKYRRISKDDTNDDRYFDYVGNNAYRYFQWQRIRWCVLDNNDNGFLFVMADSALDCKRYNDENMDIIWEDSTIRSWLSGSFYHTAFNSAEQNAIEPWDVVNKDNPKGGSDTTDKVYLLSIGEITDERYGFCSDYHTYSPSRRLQDSEYAHARGAGRSTDIRYGGDWWLRSPGNYGSGNAAYVSADGDVLRNGCSIYYNNNHSVVPVLHINLSSDLWLMEDDGTSGEGGGTSTGGNQTQNPPNPDSQPTAPQPTGTSLTASQVTSRTDTVPQEASFTVTGSDPADPTVSFDGVSDENAAAVTIPKTITYKDVEYKVTTVSPTAFSTKKDNAKFTVTDNRVESLTVEYKAPSNAKKTKVTVPETTTYKGIKFKVTSVAAKSFKNNKKVKQVSVAGSVTKIGDSSFEGCTSLKSVTLGKGTSTIGKNAFKNCKKLTKITIKSTKLKTVGKNALKGINAKCKIKVPAKQLKKYQNLFKKKGQKNSVKLVK